MRTNIGMLVSEVEDVKRSVLCLMRRIERGAVSIRMFQDLCARYVHICNT